MSTTKLVALVAALTAFAVPATASAQATTEERFEFIATADFNFIETCDDGTTAESRAFVRAGHEEESENGETTLDSDYLRVGIDSGCDGTFISQTSNDVVVTFSPSLQTAHAVGTVTSRDGQVVEVDVTWDGVGPLESDQNQVTFPGTVRHFIGRRRDAVATGTVTIDGETYLDNGTTTFADLETLDDREISTPAPEEEF